MKILWHKHSLMISSSVGSAQYSWGISYEYLTGWGNLSRKIISIKRNHYSNLVFFFSSSDFPSRTCCDLSGKLYFWRSYFFTLFQSDYFDRTVIFSEQLLFQSSCFFLLFQNSHFFKAGSFAQNQLFQKNYILEKADVSEKQYYALATFSWRAAFLEWLLFQKTVPPIVATFSEDLIFYNILFQKSCYFTATLLFHS